MSEIFLVFVLIEYNVEGIRLFHFYGIGVVHDLFIYLMEEPFVLLFLMVILFIFLFTDDTNREFSDLYTFKHTFSNNVSSD